MFFRLVYLGALALVVFPSFVFAADCAPGEEYFYNPTEAVGFCLAPCPPGQRWMSTVDGSYKECVDAVGDTTIDTGLEVIQKTAVVFPTAAATDVLARAGKAIGDLISFAVHHIDRAPVQELNTQVVAPTLLAVSTVTLAPSLSNLFPSLVQFLVLQPVLLIGRRKRYAWGSVYDSLTKLPIALATVRLLDNKTGKVRQTRVTDTDGRYLFLPEPGEYRIEVAKQAYLFPTKLLAGVSHDGRLADVYHGGPLRAGDKVSELTPAIPLDPTAKEKTPFRIVWERRLRTFQYSVALFSVIMAFFSMLVSPVWYMIVFFLIHVSLFLLFVFFVRPRRPKQWGIVSDARTGRSLNKVVIRLFSKALDKLVATHVTDRAGRYAFLVGEGDFYLISEKKGYSGQAVRVDRAGQKQGFIRENIRLRRDK